MKPGLRLPATLMIALAACGVITHAQQGGRGPQAPPTARAAAPFDLTGQWVSLITEDWRHRQFTPPRGDYASLPLSPAGRKIADNWDPARRSRRRAMQGVRRSRSSTVADPAPHRMAGRHDAEVGNRRRDANAHVAVRIHSGQRRRLTGALDRVVGLSARRIRRSRRWPCARWIAQGHHDEDEARLPAKERCSLQR